MGLEFFYSQPVRIWFGAGQFERLGEVLAVLGLKRCIAVCDPFLKGRLETLSARIGAICSVFSGLSRDDHGNTPLYPRTWFHLPL